MTRVARGLVGAAVHLLPRQSRRRYGAELDAEVRSLPARRQVGYALAVLLRAPLLRWVLLVGLCGGASPVRCWLGWHRSRTVHPNREQHWIVALECTSCGRVRDPRQYHRAARPLDGVAWAGQHWTR